MVDGRLNELQNLVAETTRANAKAISNLNTANVKAISDLNMAIVKTISGLLTAVNDARSDTNKIIIQFTQTIGSVRTTAEEAKGLATNAKGHLNCQHS